MNKVERDQKIRSLEEQIMLRQQEIERIRVEIEQLKSIGVCPTCGIEIEDESLFCPNCGTRIIKAGSRQEDGVCPQCGSLLKDDAKFCIRCGFQLKSDKKSIRETVEEPIKEPDQRSYQNYNIGQSIEWEDEDDFEDTSVPRLCPKCGAELADDSIFCLICGAKL